MSRSHLLFYLGKYKCRKKINLVTQILWLRHKDGPKITKVNETIFTIFPLFSRCFITLLPVVTDYTCCPWVRLSSPGPVMTRQAPDTERNIMNYGPAHTSLASWPLSGFTWNSCSQPKLVRASSCPGVCWREYSGQGTRRRSLLSRTFKNRKRKTFRKNRQF